MAITVTNPTYFGQPLAAPAGGQVVADQTSGPLARKLYGQAVATLDGSATTGTVNVIDGVQSFGKTFVLFVQSVTAPATINGQANTAIYSSTGADSQVKVGDSVVFAGFSNSGNNGTFTVTGVNSVSVQVVNASSVAETSPSATLTDVQNAIPVAVYANTSTESGSAYIGIEPLVLSSTGWTFVLSGAGTNAHTLKINFMLIFPGI